MVIELLKDASGCCLANRVWILCIYSALLSAMLCGSKSKNVCNNFFQTVQTTLCYPFFPPGTIFLIVVRPGH